MQDSRLIIGLGYLGLPLAKRWIAQGFRVFATTRERDRFPQIQKLGAEPIRFDVTEEDNDELPQVDVVVYAVGFDRSAGKSMHEVYVGGLSKTIAAIARPKLFCYVSSTGVYGDAGGGWVDEETPCEPTDESGRVCLEAEATLTRIAGERTIPWSIIRLGGIYGPGRLLAAPSLMRGEPLAGDPDGYLNLIHVEDAAGAVDLASNRTVSGKVFNVTDGSPTTRHTYYSELASLLGAPEPRFSGEPRTRARGNRRISNARLVDELGFVPRYPDFRAGLRESIDLVKVKQDARNERDS